LKKLYSELKIPLSERDLVPLLISDGEICWVVGYKRGRQHRWLKTPNGFFCWLHISTAAFRTGRIFSYGRGFV